MSISSVTFIPNSLGCESDAEDSQSLGAILKSGKDLVQFPSSRSDSLHCLDMPNCLTLREMMGFYYQKIPAVFGCFQNFSSAQRIKERADCDRIMISKYVIPEAPNPFQKRIMHALKSRFPNINPDLDGVMSYSFADKVFSPLLPVPSMLFDKYPKLHKFALWISLIALPYTLILRPLAVLALEPILRTYTCIRPNDGEYLRMRLHRIPCFSF